MFNIVFKDKFYQCRNDETLLEAFLRQGVELNFSCQKGSCQVCMMHCVDGDIPEISQTGLKPQYIHNNYFLPCQCKPANDMLIDDLSHSQLFHSSYVHSKKMLSNDVCQLLIDCDKLDVYKAGQYVNLSRPQDGLARSYSLASYPEQDAYLEFHIKRMENGELSNWIFDTLQEGDLVDIQGPMGFCHYDNCNPDTPMLMVAGDTGLAPLVGVLRQALDEGHEADIHVYHEVKACADLYMQKVMCDLQDKHANVIYYPCVPGEVEIKDVSSQPAVYSIQNNYDNLKDWRIYLAGPENIVSSIQNIASLRGVSDKQIYSDAFDLKDLRQNSRDLEAQLVNDTDKNSHQSKEKFTETDYPKPDMEIWKALDNGKKLNKILDDFYTIVYADEKLSPFFQKITKQRSIEKVYLFLRQIFTGEKVYLGDRPRNAHHWMVISDELFDYREQIMENCLRDNGMPEYLIRRWRAIEEAFRPDIVKARPWKKVVNGVELPLDGYEELKLDCGALCDSCNDAIDAGTRVRYHLRLGTIYCPSCMANRSQSA